MAIQSSAQLTTSNVTYKGNLDAVIANSAPVIIPDNDNTVRTELQLLVQDLIDSHFNKVDGIAIANVTGLTASLASKEDADATILKEANVIDNLITPVTTAPLSANQGAVLKGLIDAIHAQNSDIALDQGQANEVTAAALRLHLDDATIHFTQAAIDHTVILNKGINTHGQIDTHIADSNIHYTVGSISHTLISDIGSNSHATIDAHLASANNPHIVTLDQSVTANGLTFIKGNIYVGNGTAVIELGAGADGQVLKANSVQPSGLEWTSDIGEVNTISSVGSGISLVNGKSVFDLQIKSLTSSSSKLSISNAGTEVSFAINEGSIIHQNLGGAGSNDHAAIDAHIGSASNPHSVTMTQISPTTTKGDLIINNGGADVRLAVGSDGQVPVADSGASEGISWSNDLVTVVAHSTNTANPHNTDLDDVITTKGLSFSKGSLYVGDGTDSNELTVGADGMVLKANSAQPTGLEWTNDLGEVNTASNLTATGSRVFLSKLGNDLQFRRIDTGDAIITVVENGNKVDIAVNESGISHQNLSGAGTNTHAQIDTHISDTNNPHSVTKTQVGLSNVPNTDATNVDNHISGATNKVFTAAEQTKLSGISTSATANPTAAALTTGLTALTQAGTFTPDYGIQALINASAWGFATQDEAETFVSVLLNVQTRLDELEARLQGNSILT